MQKEDTPISTKRCILKDRELLRRSGFNALHLGKWNKFSSQLPTSLHHFSVHAVSLDRDCLPVLGGYFCKLKK